MTLDSVSSGMLRPHRYSAARAWALAGLMAVGCGTPTSPGSDAMTDSDPRPTISAASRASDAPVHATARGAPAAVLSSSGASSVSPDAPDRSHEASASATELDAKAPLAPGYRPLTELDRAAPDRYHTATFALG